MNWRPALLVRRVSDFNVQPLGALIFLAAVNPWQNAEFSTKPYTVPIGLSGVAQLNPDK
jgi:hypothetical protein